MVEGVSLGGVHVHIQCGLCGTLMREIGDNMIKLGWKRDKGESMGLVCVVVWGTCTYTRVEFGKNRNLQV